MKTAKSAVLFVFVSLVLASVAHAQSVAGLGAISGIVRDPSGAAVPNAKVIVANNSLGISRVLVTTEAGVFMAPSLVPSTGYAVAVAASGFSPYEANEIQVFVGQNFHLDVRLAVAGTVTQMVVEATGAQVDSTKTDVSQVVESSQILELPINGRRVDSFVSTVPGVVPDGNFGLTSFRGIAGGNGFRTDGNDTTNQYYNENNGRTRIQSPISQDAVQEFQVVSNNYSAEFGNAFGGIINTVTRSGSNDLHGTSYWFFRNQDFNATDIFASVNPATNKRYNTPERRSQLGVSLGGKIVKDKLFYFANYEGMWRDFPLVASITASGNPLFNATGQFTGTCGSPATPTQCDAAKKFLEREFQTVPRTSNQNLGFFKLDWRPMDKHSFTVSLNLLRWVSPNGLQTQAVLNNGNGVGNNVNSSVRSKNGRVSWTYVPTPSMVNEFRFGWFNDKLYDYPNEMLSLPTSIIPQGFLGISMTGQSYLGTASDYPRKNPLENRYEFAETLTWTRGKHMAKFGFVFKPTRDISDMLFNRTGTYSFPSFSALAADLTGNGTNNQHWQTFTQTIGNPVVDFTIKDYSFFVQDQYKATSRLTLNLGMRYDYASLPQPTMTNPDYPATGRIPNYTTGFAPRIGLAYALTNDTKTVLRVGYGTFHARYPGGLVNTFILGNGLYQKSISIQTATSGPIFPMVLPSNAAGYNPPAGSVSLNIAAADFRPPYSEQANIALERQLRSDLVLTVSGVWSRGLHLTSVNDINIGAPGPTVTYTVKGTPQDPASTFTYSTPVYVRQNRVDTRYNRINIIDAGLNSYYNGLLVQLNKRYKRGLSGNLSYTWSHAIDYGQGSAGTPNIFASGGPQSYRPGDYRGEKGTAALDVRHRLVLNWIWNPTLTKSPNRHVRMIVNGWGLAGLSTIQSAPGSTPVVSLSSAFVPTGFTVAQSGSTLNGYGGNTRAPWLPLASVPIDQIARLDVRLNKTVTVKERFQAMFTFDAFNLFNNTYFTGVNTRAYTYALTSGIPTLTYQTNLGTGTAAQGFPDGTNSRRLQLGLRLTF